MNTSIPEILQKLVYAEKKVTKIQMKNINIVFILENTDINNITLRQASVIILALSKVINRRMNTLIEECNHLLAQVTKEKPLKIPSNRNITLNIESTVFIKDDMVNLGEEDLIAMDTTILEEEYMDHPMFEMEFGDIPSIEQARESTLLNSTGIFNETTVTVKRRRTVEDRNIEIDETVFKANLRNVADILLKNKKMEPKGIEVSPKIEEFFKRQEERTFLEEDRGEMKIDNSVGFDNDTGFEMDLPSVSEPKSNSGIFEFPEDFVFNFLVQNMERMEKSEFFFELLQKASRGEMKIFQGEAFSNIECSAIRNNNDDCNNINGHSPL